MNSADPTPSKNFNGATLPSNVRGVYRIALVHRRDARGPLAVLGQDEAPLPFVPQRIFLTYEANEHSRGAHAHRVCEQILICASGSVLVRVNDGTQEEVIELSNPAQALYLKPMVWAEEFNHSLNAVLLVLASHPYDEADYIRDPQQWLSEIKEDAP